MNAPTASPALLSLSEGAAGKILELIREEGNPELKLRVFVSGGGCAGFQYGFAFEDATDVDDTVVKVGGVDLLVDPASLSYLGGASIDFVDDLEGSRFVINNPNASTTCGCGSSFSV